ncbi:MAG: hypothetical protein KVP17_002071 [Porospora cf. gigantea B]|uniref:uncharacterized protein n=1 Tax=Porospora cf. gigantea B TaxID=2853592 RepID=UPI003571C733|nr:MAG: hypothetical protein KVP17_002071 [Porospora cf. gigantea B]
MSDQPADVLGPELRNSLKQLPPGVLVEVIALLGEGSTLDEALAVTSKDLSTVNETEQYQERQAEDDNVTGPAPASTLSFTSIAKFTPLRLTLEERRYLRLLEAALDVSEYTDKVDIIHCTSKARKIASEIKQVCAILSGLIVADDYETGQRVLKDRDFKANEEIFRTIFEIGRRYKTLNPERMRDTYGKLMYLLMDSRRPEIRQALDFDLVKDVWTVEKLLTEKDILHMLEDPLLPVAVTEIRGECRSRTEVKRDIDRKCKAVKYMVSKYAAVKRPRPRGLLSLRYNLSSLWNGQSAEDAEGATEEDVEQCIYSISDYFSFIRSNQEPANDLLKYFERIFHPERPSDPRISLGIHIGQDGARLNHDHRRQYQYVKQSLLLWSGVLKEMFVLTALAESDLFSPTAYRLMDTGQGLQRVKASPTVHRAMGVILDRVVRQAGGWVGSSMIHLGDHNVPNSLIFLDKYMQIPRILHPVVSCLEKIPHLYQSTPSMAAYIDTEFGGAQRLIEDVCVDFFRHAFDGSGADNFFDAGSCIDGRLTSAWNWCSKIEKKSYYQVLLLTGFQGFDGKM